MKAYASVILAVAMSTPALAGAPIHRMPTDYGRPKPVYELKVSQAPVAGQPIHVTLADRATGQAVSNGEVAAIRPVFRGPKASPMIQWVAEVLPRDANGDFVCAGNHHVAGERMTLRGQGPGDASPVWLTLRVKS